MGIYSNYITESNTISMDNVFENFSSSISTIEEELLQYHKIIESLNILEENGILLEANSSGNKRYIRNFFEKIKQAFIAAAKVVKRFFEFIKNKLTNKRAKDAEKALEESKDKIKNLEYNISRLNDELKKEQNAASSYHKKLVNLQEKYIEIHEKLNNIGTDINLYFDCEEYCDYNKKISSSNTIEYIKNAKNYITIILSNSSSDAVSKINKDLNIASSKLLSLLGIDKYDVMYEKLNTVSKEKIKEVILKDIESEVGNTASDNIFDYKSLYTRAKKGELGGLYGPNILFNIIGAKNMSPAIDALTKILSDIEELEIKAANIIGTLGAKSEYDTPGDVDDTNGVRLKDEDGNYLADDNGIQHSPSLRNYRTSYILNVLHALNFSSNIAAVCLEFLHKKLTLIERINLLSLALKDMKDVTYF